MLRVLLLLFLVALSLPLEARPPFHSAKRILFIAARPADESVIAPFLGWRCDRGDADCAVVVMTRGEGDGDPNVRTAEMVLSAALLNLRLTQWDYADVLEPSWRGDAFVEARLRDVIATERPDMILTFDPPHGTAAQKEIARVVLDITEGENVWLIETAARRTRAWTYVAREHWDYLVRVAETHASQFDAEQIESLRNAPEETRRVWVVPAAGERERP